MGLLFISHSSADNDAALAFGARLRARGFEALFLDFDPEQGIPAGRNWEEELYVQLRRADAVVFLASPDSVASKWCAVEVSLSRSKTHRGFQSSRTLSGSTSLVTGTPQLSG